MSDMKQRILSIAAEDFKAIEIELELNLTPNVDLVKNVAGHILFSGGKRIRPLLMVQGARICDYKGTLDKKFSTTFEYLHAATLLHDDLIDDATLRRGKKPAHKVWDNPTAVLTGDFLLARSLRLAAATEITEIIKIIAGITEDMSQGEIQQLANKGRLDLSESEYIDVINRKTAVLFRGACRAGGLLAGCNPDQDRALDNYGYHLGMAFQMADDLLDYTSDSKALGKEPGADLREGKLTLPVIKTLERAEAKDRQEILKTIQYDNFDMESFTRLTEIMKTYDGIGYTWQLAKDHVENAIKNLEIFAPSETRDLLTMIAEYALVRKA